MSTVSTDIERVVRMDEASLEQLDIEIKSSLSGADKSVDKVIAKLDKLAVAMKGVDADKFFKTASAMSNLSYAIQGFSGVKAADFNRVANGIAKIGGANAGNLSGIAKSMKELTEPLKDATKIDLGKIIDSGATKNMGAANEKIRDQSELVNELFQKYRDAGKVNPFSGTSTELQQAIDKQSASIEKLKTKMEEYLAIGRNADSKTFEGMVYRFQAANKQLDYMKERMAQIDAEKEQAIRDAVNRAFSANDTENMTEAASATERVQSSFKKMASDVEEVRAGTDEIASKLNGEVAEGASKFEQGFNPSKLVAGQKYTAEYKELAAQIRNAENQLVRYRNREEKAMALGNNKGSAWKSLQYDIGQAERKLNDFCQAMNKLQEDGGDVTNATRSFSGNNQYMVAISTGFRDAEKVVKRFGRVLANVGRTAASVGKKIATGLVPDLGKLTKGFSSLMKAVKTRLIRMAISQMVNLAKQGFQNIAQGSERANAVLSSFSSNVTYLKNSFAAAFTPLLAIVEPVLTRITELLVQATNAVGMFFAAISGFGVFVKAKKVQDDYAKSLGGAAGAAKKLETATTGIDELNIITDNANSGGGGGGGGADYSDMFEEVPIDDNIRKIADAMKTSDWSILGETLAEKLNEAMRNIDWNTIQSEAARIAHGIATAINGAITTLDWKLTGYTIGQGVNTALIFADTLLSTVKWGQLGKGLADMANESVKTIRWQLLGKTIADGLNSAIDTAYGFVINFDFKEFGDSLGESFNSAIRNIHWSEMGIAIGGFLRGAIDTAYEFLNTAHLDELAEKFQTAMQNIVDSMSEVDETGMNGWEKLGASGSKLVDGLWKMVKAVPWSEIAQGLWDAFTTFLKNNPPDFYIDVGIVTLASIGSVVVSAIAKGAVERAIANLVTTAFGGSTVATAATTAGGGAVSSFGAGAIKAAPVVGVGIAALGAYLVAFLDKKKRWEEAGGNSIIGYSDGIDYGTDDAVSQVDTTFTAMNDAANDHISDKKWYELAGEALGGFKTGVEDNGQESIDAVSKASEETVNAMNKGKSGSLSKDFNASAFTATDSFKTGIETNKVNPLLAVNTWANDTNTNFTNVANRNSFDEHAMETITGFKDRITTSHVQTKTPMESWAKNDNTWFTSIASKTAYSNFSNDIIQSFATKTNTQHKDTKAPMETWAKNDNKWFTDIASKKAYQTFASDDITAFSDKIKTGHGESNSAMTGWAKDTVDNFEKPNGESLVSKFTSIAGNIISGFTRAIRNKMQDAIDAIGEWAEGMVERAEEELDINSPSRVFRQIGIYTVEGFNEGIRAAQQSSIRTVNEWANQITATEFGLNISSNIDSVNSKIANMKANYGSGFTVDSVIKQVGSNQNTNRSFMEASFNVDAVQSAVAAVMKSDIIPILQQSAEYARITSEKNLSTNVRIGNKVVASAVEENKTRNGYSFTN